MLSGRENLFVIWYAFPALETWPVILWDVWDGIPFKCQYNLKKKIIFLNACLSWKKPHALSDYYWYKNKTKQGMLLQESI